MMRLILVVLLTVGMSAPSWSQVTQRDLESVSGRARVGAQLPLATPVQTLSGAELTLGDVIEHKPALLVFADFTCATLCTSIVGALANVLTEIPSSVGRDFNVLIVGLDPKDDASQAAAFRDRQAESNSVAAEFKVLRSTEFGVAQILSAAGEKVIDDPDRDQFAHATSVLVLTGHGVVSRELDALALTPRDLQLALTEAGQGRIGTVAERLALICYGWDAARGIYTFEIRRALTLGGALTVGGLGVLVGMLLWRRRPKDA